MNRKASLSSSHKHVPRIARIYIRQSNSSGRGDSEDNQSPRLQMEQGRPYCQIHGFSLDEEASLRHADVDQRAFRRVWRKRPGLVGHYEDAKAGLFQDLIVYKLSRLARNAREGLEIFAEFEALGVAIHVVKEGIDTATASGRLMRTIMLGVSEMEAENTSQFVSDAIRSRHSQGKPWRHPHWLQHVTQRDASGKIVSDQYVLAEPGASAVRRLAALRIEGRSYVDISRQLNAEGFQAARSRWCSSTVRYALLPHNLDAMEGNSPGIELPRLANAWPRLLTEEEAGMLRHVQEAYSTSSSDSLKRPGNGKNRGKAAETTFLLSSLVYCGECGKSMYTQVSHGGRHSKSKKPYYVCRAPAGYTEGPHNLHAAPKGGLYAAGHMLHDAAARVIRLAVQNPPPAKKQPASRSRLTAQSAQSAKSDKIDGEIIKLTRQLDNLARMRMEERIDGEEYDRLRADLLKKRVAIEKLSPTLAASATSIYGNAASVLSSLSASTEEDVQRAWRETFVLMLQRVDVRMTPPDEIAALEPLNSQGKPREWVRVVLRYPCTLGDVFWAPLYHQNWTGDKSVHPGRQTGPPAPVDEYLSFTALLISLRI